MNDSEHQQSAEPQSAENGPASTVAKSGTHREQEKKQRLARALRDNLLRRKVAKTKE